MLIVSIIDSFYSRGCFSNLIKLAVVANLISCCGSFDSFDSVDSNSQLFDYLTKWVKWVKYLTIWLFESDESIESNIWLFYWVKLSLKYLWLDITFLEGDDIQEYI